MTTNSDLTEVWTETSFGEWLIGKGLLSARLLHEALTEQSQNGGRLGEVLVRLKIFEDNDLTRHLGEYLSLDYVRIDSSFEIDMDIARMIPQKTAERFCLIVIGEEVDGRIVVAMADPLDVVAVDTVGRKMRRPVKVVIASANDIDRAIEAVYQGAHIEEQRLRELVSVGIDTEEEEMPDDDMLAADISSEDASKPPVINFVDLLLSQAVKSKASDIHIEPQEKSMVVRMRVDGLLRGMIPPSRKMQRAVATRVKILANMDVAERRLPQDGRFKIKAPGRDIDVRVSTLPTIYGEKIAMRILDKQAVNHDLNVLGFNSHLLEIYKSILKQPHGIIIITGPTGSGKTTTLYASLDYLKDAEKNITMVEDPVEYRMKGVNQVQVRPEIDLDFAACLRSIMRQDPDIVLIGEIRDKETVEISIQASFTGHLVLSTFHTNDAPSAITRLVFMGAQPYLLASTLHLVIAQRLVRRVCPLCKAPYEPEARHLHQLRIDNNMASKHTFYRGRGCGDCMQTGYSGRLPLFEFLPVNDQMRDAIIAGESEAKIRAMARQAGHKDLREDGAARVLEGLTTPEEVLKVSYSDEINL